MFINRNKKYKQLSDTELLALYKLESDSLAFSIIYERYAHLVMGVCLKYLRDEAEAQDLSSKIFEDLTQKLRKHEITYFKSWLYQNVKNECLMLLRKRKYLFVQCELMEIEEENDTIYKEEKIALLERAISELNQEQKECILLFYIEDKSYLEISQQKEMELNKVKSYIQNGKRNLKNILQDHEEFKEH